MLHGWTPSIGHYLAGAVLLILCLAAAHDVLARTVPNWMPMTLATLGVIQSALAERLIVSLLVGTTVFILTGLCWKRGWLGGGDVKLLGAAAIAVPPVAVPPFVAAVALAGGVLGLVYLACGKLIPAMAPRRPTDHPPVDRPINRPAGLLSRAWRLERRRLSRGGPLPYAVAIAAGGLFIFL
ncbi:MAG TPA: A24 family peptidase [Acetobacteraceae bacterium]|nr:A24 family peptidase [Acetobacteraceae bacterium]